MPSDNDCCSKIKSTLSHRAGDQRLYSTYS